MKNGYLLETNSDTEVLIKAIHCWGIKALEKCVGMFAFALYNCHTHEVILARDRLGIKPLYYSLRNGLTFGSELRMVRELAASLTIDDWSVQQYFRFGYVPGERTIFKEIKKLLPGHYLRYANGWAEIKCWWNFPASDAETQILDEEPLHEKLEQLMINAFAYRLVSDVPVGVFLSGGIDSSLVATLLAHHSGKKINTFTIGFHEQGFDERDYARKLAKRLNVEHTEFLCDWQMAEALLADFYAVYDEPFSDTSGIPLLLLSGQVKQQGTKVVLSADGGDELFGGYEHYQRISQWANEMQKIPPGLRHAGARCINLFLPTAVRQRIKWANLPHRISRLEELLKAGSSAISFYEASISNLSLRELKLLTRSHHQPAALINDAPTSLPENMMRWDARYYLPDDLLVKVDRATMFTGIEAREPMLDHRLVEWSARLPLSEKINNGKSKWILRKILHRYHPPELFNRPKHGFTIPLFLWFGNKLRHVVLHYLSPPCIEKYGILNNKVVQYELNRFLYYQSRNKSYNMEKIWRMVSFMMWCEKWMK